MLGPDTNEPERELMLDITELVPHCAFNDRPESLPTFLAWNDRLLTLAEANVNGVGLTLVRDDFSGKILLKVSRCLEL